MAEFLTGDTIADRMLAHLTDEVVFIPRINTQYDSSFRGKGAKTGSSVKVRKPQRAKIRYGRIVDETPIADQWVSVSVTDQIGVDVGANSADLSLNIDDFDAQYIRPFARDLAVAIDAWALRKVIPQVPETVGDYGALDDMDTVLQAGERLDYNLAPKADRTFLVNPRAQRSSVTAFSTLFNNQATIGKQYQRGRMGADTLGFDWYSTTMMPTLQRGTANGSYLVNGANQSGGSLAVDGGTGTIKKGDTFTITGVQAVHPQTKEPLGYLREFTVLADHAGGAGTLQITPSIVFEGTEQNVSQAPPDNNGITVEGTSGAIYGQNLAFSRDLAYFVTADLPLPKKMEAAGSRTLDGINLRYIQGYDITNDRWISRFDILAGSGILYPEYGVRVPNSTT